MPQGQSAVVSAPRRALLVRRIPWHVAVELLALIALLAALTRSTVGWIVVVLALLVVVALVLPVGGLTLVGRLQRRIGYLRRSPQPIDRDRSPEVLALSAWLPNLQIAHTVTGRGEEIGIVSDGTAWSAVLAITDDDQLLADRGEELSLRQLAGLTRQDDIIFAGVQVLTYTVPAPATLLLSEESAAARSYRELAPTIPPAVQRTWICLRLDPQLCLQAVARRGSDLVGIHATLRFGLHRVQALLKRQGVVTRALGPAEVGGVIGLVAGVGLEDDGSSSETWNDWRCEGLVHAALPVRSWGSAPTVAYGKVLAEVTRAPVLFAVTSHVEVPGRAASGSVRLVAPSAAGADRAARALVGAMGRGPRLDRGAGMQVPAMLATLPLGREVVR